jgi:DNA-binding Xre family transcriptional regulator
MALEKLKSICVVMGCTPNDISELLPDNMEGK